MLSTDTIKAIEAEIKARKRNMRLAQSMRQERERQIRKLVRDGFGWEDLMHPDRGLGLSREAARAAVFGRGK